MEIGIIVGIIILVIFFGILLKDFWDKQQRNEIIIYRNLYDLFFNCIVYVLPAIVFLIKKPGFDPLLCYVLLCIGFTIFMCISAWDTKENDTTGKKIAAAIIKIVTGIEVPLVIIIVLALLALALGGKEEKRRRNNNSSYYNYSSSRRRNRW